MSEPKALLPVKAEALTTSELDRWLAGKSARRILVAPFGGPVAKAKGLDIDWEYFDDEPCGAPQCKGSDFYGDYPALRETRDRLVDFSHATFLTKPLHRAEEAVKGAIMGRVVLDDHFESVVEEDQTFAGLWGDFWANAGEKRRSLIRWLEEHNHPLYGSSQPVAAGVRRGKAGHLCVWPIAYHTISTSPQNTYAIVPPVKAVLDGADAAGIAISDQMRSLLAEMLDLAPDLRRTSGAGPGDDVAKAGRELSGTNEAEIVAALEEVMAGNNRLIAFLDRIRGKYAKEVDT